MASPRSNIPPLRNVTLLVRGSESAWALALPPTLSLAAPHNTTANRASFVGVMQAAGARPATPPPSPAASMQLPTSHEPAELNTPDFERLQFEFPGGSGQQDSGHFTFDNTDLFSGICDGNDWNALQDEVASSTRPEEPSHQGPEPSGPAPPHNLNQDRGAPLPTNDLSALLATGNTLSANDQILGFSLHSTALLETQSAGHVTPTRSTNNAQAAPSHLSSTAANTVQPSVHTNGNASNIHQTHVHISNGFQLPPNRSNTSQSFVPGGSSHVDHAGFPMSYQQPQPGANSLNHDFLNYEGEIFPENTNYIPPINTSSQLSPLDNALLEEILNMKPSDLLNEISTLSENFESEIEDISRNETAAPLPATSDASSEASFLAAAPEPHSSFEYHSLQPSVLQVSDSRDSESSGATVQQGSNVGTCFLGEGPSEMVSAVLQQQMMNPSSVTQSQGRQQVGFISALTPSHGQQEQVVPLQNALQQMVYVENVQQHNAQNLILTPMPFAPNAVTPSEVLASNAHLSTGRIILQNVRDPSSQILNEFTLVDPQLHSQNQTGRHQTTQCMDGETSHRRMPTSEHSHLQNTSSVFMPLLKLSTQIGPPVVVSVPEEHHPAQGIHRRRGAVVMWQRASDQHQGLVVQQGMVVQQQGSAVQQHLQRSLTQSPTARQRCQGPTQQKGTTQQETAPMQQSATMSLQLALPNGQQHTQVRPLHTQQQLMSGSQQVQLTSQTQTGQIMPSRFIQQQQPVHRVLIPQRTVQPSIQQRINLSPQQQRTPHLSNLAQTRQPSQMCQPHQPSRISQQQQQPSQISQQQQPPSQISQQFLQPTMPVRLVPGYSDPDQGGIITKRVVIRKNASMGAQPVKILKINTNVKNASSRSGPVKVPKLFTDGKRIFMATTRSEPYPVAAETSASDQDLWLHGSVSAPNLPSQLTTNPSNSGTSRASSSDELRDLLASIEIPCNASNLGHLQLKTETNVPQAVQEHGNEAIAVARHPTIEQQPSTSTGFTGAQPRVPAGTSHAHWSVGPSSFPSAREEPESSEEDELNDADDDDDDGDEDVRQTSFNGSSEESCSGSGGKGKGGRAKERGVGPMRRSRGQRSARASEATKFVRLSRVEQKRIDAEKYRKNVEANNLASKKCREKRKEKELKMNELFRSLSLKAAEQRECLQRLEKLRDILQEGLKFLQKKPPKEEKE